MLKIGNALFVLIAFLFFSFIPLNLAKAHSVLIKSTPEDGEQVDDTINSIELNFNTKVENGSTLYLVTDTGEEMEPESIDISDDVLQATFKESLQPGSYQVNWKIVGADGHPIENQYSFSIAEPETMEYDDTTSQTEDGQTDSSAADNNSKNDDEAGTEQNNQNSETQNASEQKTEDDNGQSNLGSGIIIVLIIAGLVILAWMLFSKRKN